MDEIKQIFIHITEQKKGVICQIVLLSSFARSVDGRDNTTRNGDGIHLRGKIGCPFVCLVVDRSRKCVVIRGLEEGFEDERLFQRLVINGFVWSQDSVCLNRTTDRPTSRQSSTRRLHPDW